MPVHYEIDTARGYVCARYVGRVVLSDVVETFRAFQADPEFRPDLVHLVDLSRIDNPEAGFAELFSLFSMYARAYDAAGTAMRCAIFTPDEITFGLARIFENLAETSSAIEVRLFDDFDTASAWAGARAESGA